MISRGRLRAEKGSCQLRLDDLVEFGANLALLIHPPDAQSAKHGMDGWQHAARRLTRRFGPDCYLLLAPKYDGQDPERFDHLTGLAKEMRLETIASDSAEMYEDIGAVLALDKAETLGLVKPLNCAGCCGHIFYLYCLRRHV